MPSGGRHQRRAPQGRRQAAGTGAEGEAGAAPKGSGDELTESGIGAITSRLDAIVTLLEEMLYLQGNRTFDSRETYLERVYDAAAQRHAFPRHDDENGQKSPSRVSPGIESSD